MWSRGQTFPNPSAPQRRKRLALVQATWRPYSPCVGNPKLQAPDTILTSSVPGGPLAASCSAHHGFVVPAEVRASKGAILLLQNLQEVLSVAFLPLGNRGVGFLGGG